MPDAGRSQRAFQTAANAMASPELILGFDYGTRRVGVACGNTLTGSARPLKTLAHGARPPWDDIAQLVKEFNPSRLVVGLPYNMDGSDTALTQTVRDFAAQLQLKFSVPVVLVDERLSSRAAESDLRNARASGLKRRRVTHGDVDMAAAKLLVEQYLGNS
jgi:putative holliday junction resolvase